MKIPVSPHPYQYVTIFKIILLVKHLERTIKNPYTVLFYFSLEAAKVVKITTERSK